MLNKFEHYIELIEFQPSVQKIERMFPDASVRSLFSLYYDAYEKQGKRLIFHILNLLTRAEEIGQIRGVRTNDLIDTYIAIYYHDCAKVLQAIALKNTLLSQVLKLSEGHSVSSMRLFLYVDEPRIAHGIRHNSVDLALDIVENKVTVPELLLNLVDKTDDAGTTITIKEKYKLIKYKIGSAPDYDDYSEQLVCKYLDRILSEKTNLYDYEFMSDEKIPTISSIFVQRWDGKYCPPIGKYQHTNSNLYITKYISNWGYKTTILHEGLFKHLLQDNSTQILGIPEDTLSAALPLYCHNKNLVIIEGSTTRVEYVRKVMNPSSALVLLLRTMALGSMGKERLLKASLADEIWVMTEEMKTILTKEFEEYKLPQKSIKLLQSGVDDEVFCINEKVERKHGKITYVGAMTKIKGVDLLIEAFRKIKSKYPEAELNLIGDQSIYGRVNEFISQDELESIPGVIFHGSLLAEQIAPILQSSQVACLLTTIYETYGKSAMQARCCGTPMVVSSQGNNPFHVQSDEEGLVIDNLNVDSIFAALDKVLSSPPKTVAPPIGRYHSWKVTALDFISNLNYLRRDTLRKCVNTLGVKADLI